MIQSVLFLIINYRFNYGFKGITAKEIEKPEMISLCNTVLKDI